MNLELTQIGASAHTRADHLAFDLNPAALHTAVLRTAVNHTGYGHGNIPLHTNLLHRKLTLDGRWVCAQARCARWRMVREDK